MIPIGLAAILWLEQPVAKPILIPTSVVLTAPPKAVQAVKQPIPLTSPSIVSVSSTSYCQSGIMADGQMTHMGAAAGNMWPLGTRLEILTGSHQGTSVTIEDRIGWGSQLDFFTWSCRAAIDYGREQIEVEVLER